MEKSINILDKDYVQWVKELSLRYRQSQIRSAVKVNQEMLRFYWELGKDIVRLKAESRWGSGFFKNLSRDLKVVNPESTCFSPTNLLYMKNFYLLYQHIVEFTPQVVEQLGNRQITQQLVEQIQNTPQPEEQLQNRPQLGDKLIWDIFSIPWGHHIRIIDKCINNPSKALFFVRKTIENGWSRNMLLNALDTDLYERQGKALNNFTRTLPEETSDLANEILKDPYNFAFAGITGKYNERKLKDALIDNITKFLMELGTGFAYVGKEYRLQIGYTEKFIDLLFYNLNLSCYVVIEVKIGKFDFVDAGQLGGYVVACNHLLRKEGRDNPTIGLLICKEKDNLLAQYALESNSQPIGISEFELQKLYPTNVEGTIPSIEEIEKKLLED